MLIYKVKLISNLIVCRPDHNLQHIREKIFPFKKEKENIGTPIAELDHVSGPNTEVPTSSVVARARRLERVSQRRRESGTSVQAQVNQFWFYLVAVDDQ